MSTKRFDITETKPKYTGDARLLYISAARYSGDWHCSPHSHQCTELFYVVGGTGGFQIESDYFQVKSHDLVVVNAGVQHTETSCNSAPLEYIVLGVEGLELSLPEKEDDRYFLLSFTDRSETVLPVLKIMLKEMEQKQPGSDSICQNLLQVLLIQLMRSANLSPEKTVQATRRECATAKWYIDAHFKEKITLDRLAQVAGVNKFYLSHSFKEEYGISPIQYLVDRRIDESRYLISSTDLPIGCIVQMLGFSSPSYFAQMFRRAEGVTPSEYRENAKSSNKSLRS